jgi:hypothetical protein
MQVYKEFQSNSIGKLIFNFINAITNQFLLLIAMMNQPYKFAIL